MAYSIRGGGGRRGRRNWREWDSRIGKDGEMETEMTRRTRYDQMDILWIRHNLSRNTIGMVSNAPLASAMGK